LRKDDPAALKDIILLIQSKAKAVVSAGAGAGAGAGAATSASVKSTAGAGAGAEAEAEAESKADEGAGVSGSSFPLRVRFMLDMIYDLKNNKRRLAEAQTGLIEPLKKWLTKAFQHAKKGNSNSLFTPSHSPSRMLRAFRCLKCKRWVLCAVCVCVCLWLVDSGDRQLHLSYADIMSIPEKGRWWIVGSSFRGNMASSRTTATVTATATASKSAAASEPDSDGTPAPAPALTPAPAPAPARAACTIGPLIRLCLGYGFANQVSGGDDVNLLKLARSQRMNTQLRKNVFFVVMSAEVRRGDAWRGAARR
jgi:hypothetical protein